MPGAVMTVNSTKKRSSEQDELMINEPLQDFISEMGPVVGGYIIGCEKDIEMMGKMLITKTNYNDLKDELTRFINGRKKLVKVLIQELP